jgi:hypothetical protein
MDFSQTISSEWTQTEYAYRYFSRRFIIVSILWQAMFVLGFAWLAVKYREVLYLFGILFFSSSILLYGWLAVLDARNKFVIKVSPTGIYLPFFWKRGATDFLPFSALSGIELIKARKTTILKFSAGKKIRFVSEIYFPQKQDFKKLISIVQRYSPVPVSGDPI